MTNGEWSRLNARIALQEANAYAVENPAWADYVQRLVITPLEELIRNLDALFAAIESRESDA